MFEMFSSLPNLAATLDAQQKYAEDAAKYYSAQSYINAQNQQDQVGQIDKQISKDILIEGFINMSNEDFARSIACNKVSQLSLNDIKDILDARFLKDTEWLKSSIRAVSSSSLS